jgi:hypothetical protein
VLIPLKHPLRIEENGEPLTALQHPDATKEFEETAHIELLIPDITEL